MTDCGMSPERLHAMVLCQSVATNFSNGGPPQSAAMRQRFALCVAPVLLLGTPEQHGEDT